MKKIIFINILFIFTLFGLGAPRQSWSIPDNQVIAVYGTNEDSLEKAVVADVNGDSVQDLVVCVPKYDDDPDSGCTEEDEGDPYDSSDDVAGSDPDDGECNGYDGGAVVIFTSRLIGGARMAVTEETYEIDGDPYDATDDRTETLSGPDIVIADGNDNDNFGDSCANAGDVNNDGYDDILIGTYQNDDAATNAGAAYLLLGSSTLADTTASSLVQYTGEASSDYAGYSVAGAGDVNNDGYDDMLIGAYLNDDGGTSAGAAYLVLGSSSPASASLSSAVEYTGEASSDYAGRSVAGAGDVNNDGYDDMLIGAYQNDDGGTNAGTAYLVLGSSSPASASLSSAVEYTGEAAGDYAGASVAGAGDVNNDGYDDILIGAYMNDDGGSNAGAAYLVLGSSSPTSVSLSSARVEFTCNASSDYCGSSVAGVGDTNGDGYDDLLIGARNEDGGTSYNLGGAYLVYGASKMRANVSLPSPRPALGQYFLGNSDSDYFGGFVSGAGDYNGDGKTDIIVGASGYDIESSSSDEGAVYLILRPNLPSGADRTMPEL